MKTDNTIKKWATDKDELDYMIGRWGFKNVLQMLVEIADANRQHFRTADVKQSDDWMMVASMLDDIRNDVPGIGSSLGHNDKGAN